MPKRVRRPAEAVEREELAATVADAMAVLQAACADKHAIREAQTVLREALGLRGKEGDALFDAMERSRRAKAALIEAAIKH